MANDQQSQKQKARETSRSMQNTNINPHYQQDFASREIQHGTERSETQIEGGQRRNDAGDKEPAPQEQRSPQDVEERGDARREYKRAGR